MSHINCTPTGCKFEMPSRFHAATAGEGMFEYALYIRRRDNGVVVHVVEGIKADTMADGFNRTAEAHGHLLQSYSDGYALSLVEISRIEKDICRDTFRRVYETHLSNETKRLQDEADRAEYERLRAKFERNP